MFIPYVVKHLTKKLMSTDKTNNFSHIRFGFRGEGIFYKLNGKEYELWSTWADGIRICKLVSSP